MLSCAFHHGGEGDGALLDPCHHPFLHGDDHGGHADPCDHDDSGLGCPGDHGGLGDGLGDGHGGQCGLPGDHLAPFPIRVVQFLY